jgi:hypothetical protein
MADKERRSEAELAALVMQELRRDPTYGMVGVAITRPVSPQPGGANWGASFIRAGDVMTPSEASEIVRELQRKYDLA